MAGRDQDVTMEGVRIIIRNFSGKIDVYNKFGKRSFLVLLPDDVAQAMAADGWNVKYLKPKEEGDTEQPFLKVTVNMDGDFPPRVVMVTERNKTLLDADTVALLDTADITNVDLIVSPYYYDMTATGGGKGISAYLRKGYFTINEDDLERKYGDIPDTAENSQALQSLYQDDEG